MSDNLWIQKSIYTEAKRFGEIEIIPLGISWNQLASTTNKLGISMNIEWRQGNVFYSDACYAGLCVADELAFATCPPDSAAACAAENRWESLRLVLEQAIELRRDAMETGNDRTYRNGWYDLPPDRWIIGDGKLYIPEPNTVVLEGLKLLFWVDNYPRYVSRSGLYNTPLTAEQIRKQRVW